RLVASGNEIPSANPRRAREKGTPAGTEEARRARPLTGQAPAEAPSTPLSQFRVVSSGHPGKRPQRDSAEVATFLSTRNHRKKETFAPTRAQGRMLSLTVTGSTHPSTTAGGPMSAAAPPATNSSILPPPTHSKPKGDGPMPLELP